MFPADPKGMATRISGGKALNGLARNIPWLLGGSADLAPSTKTLLTFDEAGGSLSAENPGGRNMHFGIRERHGRRRQRHDPLRPAHFRRTACLQRLLPPVDHPPRRADEGPVDHCLYARFDRCRRRWPHARTHEQRAACRAIPRLLVLRPADANEASQAWRVALAHNDRPSALILTRQDLPTFDRTNTRRRAVSPKAVTSWPMHRARATRR